MTGPQDLIICSKCGVEAERYAAGTRRCRPCALRGARERAAMIGPEAVRAAAAKWKKENPEKVRLQRKAAAEKVGREYRTKAQITEERQLDRWASSVRARVKLARRLSRPWKNRAEYYRWRMATDPRFVVHQRMRTATKKALRGMKSGRKWESLVGYTLTDLMGHLERQMPRGFTLADLGSGRIHIDHIVPKSTFDVTDPTELRVCWALSNLRPVTAKVNMKKGAKRVSLL